MTERSVITGIGILSPNGVGKNEFLAAVRAGKSGVRRVEHLDLSDCDTKIAGFIDDDRINPLWADRKAKSRLDRAALLSLIGSEMAVVDSGLDGLSELPVRKGIVLGTGCGTVGTNEAAYHRFYALQKHRLKPTTVPRAMYNAAACEIGIRHGLRRISNTVVTACSSALVALDLAYLYIRSGKADLILVGGVYRRRSVPQKMFHPNFGHGRNFDQNDLADRAPIRKARSHAGLGDAHKNR